MGQASSEDGLAQDGHEGDDVVAQGEGAGHDGAGSVIEYGDEEGLSLLAFLAVDLGAVHGIGKPKDLGDARRPAAESILFDCAPASLEQTVDGLDGNGTREVALESALHGLDGPAGVISGELKELGAGFGIEGA